MRAADRVDGSWALQRAWARATVTLLCIVALAAGGCAKGYVVVELSGTQTSAKGGKVDAEVNPAPSFATERLRVRSVTFRIPDRCVTRMAEENGRWLIAARAECLWLVRSLERAVDRAGYRVIAWDALKRVEKRKGVATFMAARHLGADVVFVLNALSLGLDDASPGSGRSLDYFASNPDGEKLSLLPLPARSRERMRELVLERAGGGKPATLNAALDATAILTTTGDSIWTYRRTSSRPLVALGGLRFLLRGRDIYWRPVVPQSLVRASKAAPRPDDRSSRDVINEVTPAANAAAATAAPAKGDRSQRLLRLLAELANASATDFADRFGRASEAKRE